jgi:ankyrin repeat protein
LSKATRGKHDATCRFILRHGTIVDSKDKDGNTALSKVAIYNTHTALRMILAHGANPLHTNHDKSTILHILSASGELRDGKTIVSSSSNRFDPDAKDIRGRTAREYLQIRVTSRRVRRGIRSV